MKAKYFLPMLLAVPLCLGVAACGGGENPQKPIDGTAWELKSPDQSLKMQIVLDNFGSLTYTVVKDKTPVVETSSLGFELAEDNLSEMLVFDSVETQEIDFSYQNISGKHATVDVTGSETKLTFKGSSFYLDVTARIYDDGYAFRYGIRAMDDSEGTMQVIAERSEFALPSDSTTYIQPYKTNTSKLNCFSYEEAYTRKKAKSLAGRKISMPMLYQAGDTDVWSLITESELIGSGFYGSFLEEQPENEGMGILQTVPSPAGVQQDNDMIAYPFESPWRVASVGSMADVIESEIVEKVYGDVEYWKPDNYADLSPEEQETYNYDWVEPGVVAWNWLKNPGRQTDFTLHREYVDLAADMGWTYMILDGGWNSGLNVENFKQFTAYAHSKGVKVIAWCNALTDFSNGSASALELKLGNWKSWGIDGIKIDFFDGQNATNPTHQGEDVNTIKWYETIYQVTARLRMIVNCHGANKPTGERRIYPHVMNREAIRGNEFTSVDSTIIVNSLFVRMTVGPTDFTPVVKPYTKGTTMAHQMALAVLYESGTPSMADLPVTYADGKINDFYKAVPCSAWDEIKYLGGELDGYFMAAIRVGDDWFVAGVNTITERTVDIDLSFLGDGSYTATLFTDDASSNTQVTREDTTLTKSDSRSVRLAPNGGFAFHLVKN